MVVLFGIAVVIPMLFQWHILLKDVMGCGDFGPTSSEPYQEVRLDIFWYTTFPKQLQDSLINWIIGVISAFSPPLTARKHIQPWSSSHQIIVGSFKHQPQPLTTLRFALRLATAVLCRKHLGEFHCDGNPCLSCLCPQDLS